MRRNAARGLFILLFLAVAACTPTNFELSTATTPECSASDIAEWQRVVDQSQGVRGLDPAGNFIADFPGERFGIFSINNWHPLSGYKETLCGELHHFNVRDGSGAEMDWNNFMIPTAGYAFIITDALPYKGGSGPYCVDDNWHDCAGQNDCLEGELTPDESFYENPWFPKSVGDSVLEGKQLCMYGPWVRECVHGHRPEIHPSELIWWKEKWGSADLYWLMAQQDDSNRYDTQDDFDIEGSLPAGWSPWAAAPMSARFQLAFAVDPAGPVLDYEIGEAFARNVVTRFDLDASIDADNGTEHAIEYNGAIVLRANENQAEDIDLGVTFTDVCRQSDGTLQGFVTLTTKTGVNNSGGEGYHVLFVTVNEEVQETPPVVVPVFEAKAILSTQGDPATLRPEAGPRLVGDLRVAVEKIAGATPQDLTIERVVRVREAGRRELVFEPGPKGAGGVVKGLPLQEPAHIEFVMGSGARQIVFWPGLAVAALAEEEILSAAPAPAESWRELVEAAGGRAVPLPSELQMERVSRVRLEAIPEYATLKDGRASLEEGSPFVERLNEVLARGDTQAVRYLFGTATPLQVQWSLEATNLGTGELVPVAREAAEKTSGGIVVEEMPGRSPGAGIQISFPGGPEKVLYEVRAVARVTDVFGTSYDVEQRVWSYFLSDTSPEGMAKALLPTLAEAAGVSADKLLVTQRLGVLAPGDPRLNDPSIRRALVVHNVALQAADDRRIMLDELSGLIQGARLLGDR